MKIKKLKFVMYAILFCIALNSCSKSDNNTEKEEVEEEEVIEEEEEEEEVDEEDDGLKQLNIVYFIPNDVEPYANYQERMSGVLYHVQKYYAEQLEANGFGYKEFGLQEDTTNPGMVKIHLINGKYNKAYYPYSDGGPKAKIEIDEYFSANPALKKSEHVLVFIPRYDIGVPFYGLGKFAFVRDYENGYDMDKWVDGVGFSDSDDQWIGGLIHELGHGLNLPHNREKVSDSFRAMMGLGNSFYYNNPTSVNFTKGSSLILSNNQIFNIDSPIDFYAETPDFNILTEKIYADTESMYLDISFTTSIPAAGFIAYHDPATKEDNSDSNYNAISWATTEIETNDGISTVTLEMPLNEIDESFKEFIFELKLSFIFENGETFDHAQSYTYEDGKPNIDIDATYNSAEIEKSKWSIQSVSHEDPSFSTTGGYASNSIDGDIDTVWHTGYLVSYDHPHEIVINMGETKTLNGISITQNQSNTSGMIKDFSISTSIDNTTFVEQGTFQATSSMLTQQFDFSSQVDVRFFKIISTSAYEARPVTRVAEFGAY